ncbi:hypothetical protein MUK42_32578 [Musa troglodytarum]|uniref:Uncharacterized protein n=1 Tax=Musa troglodytarum TaxID=320322 RepID=A0A9E7F9U3_9LILI|nr:hypothetical protein MUK42_32578 [Musa troglodytarum]
MLQDNRGVEIFSLSSLVKMTKRCLFFPFCFLNLKRNKVAG